jgi:hypothetical protein
VKSDPLKSKLAKSESSISLLPPVSAVLFVVLLVGMTSGSLAHLLLGDSSIGWHIRNGQQILASGAVPHIDSFSATMSGHAWFAWEWLYDVAVGGLDRTTGLNGVVWLTAALVALVFALLFRHVYFRSRNLLLALVLVLLTFCAATVHLLARPHIVTWLLVLLWWAILDGALEGQRRKALLLLPLLMILWVNVHGGFVLGIVLTGIALVAALWDRLRGIESDAATAGGALLKTFLAVVAASFVNPYGWRLHQHVVAYLSDRYLMRHIDEFRTPTFHFAAEWFFVALVLAALVAVVYRRREVAPADVLLLLFAVASGFYAYRNIPVACILLSMEVADLAGRVQQPAGNRAGFLARVSAAAARLGLREYGRGWLLWPVVVALLVFVACLNGGRLLSRTVITARFDASQLPVAAVEKLAALDTGEPVLAPDAWGGYLVYRLGPRIKPLVDDRHDLYGSAFLRDYLTLVRAEKGWQEILEGMHANWALLPPKSPLADRLRQAPGWNVVHEDGTAVLLLRSPSRP